MNITGINLRGANIQGQNNVPAVSTDEYFNLVSMLLPGTGTNGAQNETFVDESTNNFALTATGNPTQGTVSPFSPSGPSGYSYYFTGGDYLALSASSAFLFTGDFTIEAWVNLPAVTGGPRTIFGSRYSGSAVFDFRVFNSNIQVSLNSGSGTNLGLGTLSINRWAHMALVRSGSSIKCYVDGTQTATTLTNSSTLGFSDTAMAVGASGNVGTNQLIGYISNLRVVNGTALYTSNFTPPTQPLAAIANTSLLTCQSNRFIDNSSNGFLLTPSGVGGTPFVIPVSPLAPANQYTTTANGGSAVFDGTGDYIRTDAVDQTAFAFGTGDFTWECWIYPLQGGNNRIIGFATTAGTLQAQLYVSGTTLNYVQGGSTPYQQTYSQTFLNQWSHIAVSRVSGTSRVFVNGVQLGASFADTINYAASRFTMGTNPTTQTVYYSGYITGVKIVKGTGLYTANFTCPTALPTATNAELLLNFTNAGIVDAAAKNNLETVGSAQISTTRSKFGSSSIYLSSANDYLRIPPSRLFAVFAGDFTVECWVNYAAVILDYTVIFQTYDGTNELTLRTGDAGFGYVVQAVLGVGAGAVYTSSYTISDLQNVWTHLAFCRTGTTTRFFYNGVEQSSKTSSVSLGVPIAGYPTVGQSGYSPTAYIQDLRFTKDLGRYTANFTPPTQAFPTQ